MSSQLMFVKFIQRDNVLFGQPFDADKYWDVVDRASLLPDLQVLPDGDLTEVSLNLSF